SEIRIGIRVVGTWWWGLRRRASSTTFFTSVSALSSRFGGHGGGHCFDQVFKNLNLDLASLGRKVGVFLLVGCRGSACHGGRTERKQSKGSGDGSWITEIRG
ncbi:unnamed protein product, partial [Prunus brigantina]